jgi:hypothetical protein
MRSISPRRPDSYNFAGHRRYVRRPDGQSSSYRPGVSSTSNNRRELQMGRWILGRGGSRVNHQDTKTRRHEVQHFTATSAVSADLFLILNGKTSEFVAEQIFENELLFVS